jgi:hypothetical protein
MLIDGHGKRLKLGDAVVLFGRIVRSFWTAHDDADVLVQIDGTHLVRDPSAKTRAGAKELRIPSSACLLDETEPRAGKERQKKATA